jgi:general L-amino acid transport system substrate-binding protein
VNAIATDPTRGSSVLLALVSAILLVAVIAAPAQAGPRLDRIRQRGSLVCGVSPGIAGFSVVDPGGRYSGFEIDVCRAVAAAIFGAADRVRFVQAAGIQDFLNSPDVDLVSRRLTLSLTREAFGVTFGPIVFFDGQGFLVSKAARATEPRNLSGVPVCVDAGTPFEFVLSQYFRARKLDLRKVALRSRDELVAALAGGRCAAFTADVSELGAIRSRMPKGRDFDILREYISKEPLAPLARQDDVLFVNVLRWTMYAMIAAEELGITASNVDQMLASDDPDRKRLLGVVPGNGKALGLDERWAYNVIKGVGNYGEMFDRNVGVRSAVGLERGLNNLWTAGGLIFAPPLR